jgi:DNA-binding CsgD family transcriptional regulator
MSNPEPRSVRHSEDVNFASVVGLDATGGWHILIVTTDGGFIGDAAAVKVLTQFFPEQARHTGDLPHAVASKLMESKDWGTTRTLRQNPRNLIFYKDNMKLAAQFYPRNAGGYLFMKITCVASAAMATISCLTERELEAATLVAAGKTNGEIGQLMSISGRTVQKHLENIFRKLGLETRMALAVRISAIHADEG